MVDSARGPAAESHEVAPARKGIKKGLYLLPTAFTAANVGMGYYAVMGALRGFQLLGGGTEEEVARATVHFDNAARAIGWAILFDTLDGRIARLTKTTTEIGCFSSAAPSAWRGSTCRPRARARWRRGRRKWIRRTSSGCPSRPRRA
jgi:hypothetical protein